MNHRELSEVVAGKVVFGGGDPLIVNHSMLMAPYDKIVADAQGEMTPEDLVLKYGWSTLNAAESAFNETVKANGHINWISMLEKQAVNADLGRRLSTMARRLEKGEDPDVGKMLSLIHDMQEKQPEFVPLDQVTPQKDVWVKSYYGPVDKEVMGIPKDGLTVIGGPPGTGKTSLALKMAINQAIAGKKIAFFSLEMTLSQIVMRTLEVHPDLTKEARARIFASEEVVGVDEVYAKVARLKAEHPDLYAVYIDFADLMVEQEQSEQVMGKIYIKLAVLAKRLRLPVVLLSQLSRAYVGGEPRVNHLRYSGMAEAMASLILLLYNPDKLFADMGATRKKPVLTPLPGKAYIIVGKSRYGYKHGTYGAIRVNWRGGMGWQEDESVWTGMTHV